MVPDDIEMEDDSTCQFLNGKDGPKLRALGFPGSKRLTEYGYILVCTAQQTP